MCSASNDLLRVSLVAAIVTISCSREFPAATVTSDTPTVQVAHGRCAPVRIRWSELRAVPELRGNVVVFLHLYDKTRIVRTFDHPVNWPWTPGTSWIEEVEICQSALAPPIAPGVYELRAGVYDSDGGRRFPLRSTSEEVARNAYRIAEVQAMHPTSLPSVRVRGLWSPIRRQAMDGQIPALRWLHREGSMTVRGGAGSRLHLSLYLQHVPLLLTHRGKTHRLELGRQTWHVPLENDEEVISFAPAAPVQPRARTLTIESLAFHP